MTYSQQMSREVLISWEAQTIIQRTWLFFKFQYVEVPL